MTAEEARRLTRNNLINKVEEEILWSIKQGRFNATLDVPYNFVSTELNREIIECLKSKGYKVDHDYNGNLTIGWGE
jgi:hypothetical protein